MAVNLQPYKITVADKDYPAKHNSALDEMETEINSGLGQITANLSTLTGQITSEINTATGALSLQITGELDAAVDVVESYRDQAAISAQTAATAVTTINGDLLLAQAAAQSALTSSQAAVAAAASISDYSARVQAQLHTRGITNIKAIAFKSAEGWERTGTQSYKTESRPTGRYLGQYATVAAAWAQTDSTPASANEDWYYNTTDTFWYKLSGGNSHTRIYRAGSAHMPLEAVFVASGVGTSARLQILDLTDPNMTLWMEFIAGVNYTLTITSSVSSYAFGDMKWAGGKLLVGGSGGAGSGQYIFNYISGFAEYYGATRAIFVNGLSHRNEAAVSKTINLTDTLSASFVQSIAVHNNYIVAATTAGISVIKPDGTVVKSASTNNYTRVAILNGGVYALNTSQSPQQITYFGNIESLGVSFPNAESYSAIAPVTGMLSSNTLTSLGFAENSLLVGSANAIDQIWPSPADTGAALIARSGTTFATPPMKKPEVMLICGTTVGAVSGAAFTVTNEKREDLGASSSYGNMAVNEYFDTSTFSGTNYPVGAFMFTVSGADAGLLTPGTPIIIEQGGVKVARTIAATQSNFGLIIICSDSGVPAGFDKLSPLTAVYPASRSHADTTYPATSRHGIRYGNLTATAEVTGGVAGLSGFTSNANRVEAQNPWASIAAAEAWIACAFKTNSSAVSENIIEISYWDGAAYQDSRVLLYIGADSRLFFYVTSNAGASSVQPASTSTYDDGLVHTVVVRKTGTSYIISVDEQDIASIAVGSHGNLTFNAQAIMRVGINGNSTANSPNTTIWFAGAGKTALTPSEVSLMHTHMRNKIMGKAALDEIPTALAYDPIRKAVELVGATKRQTLQAGAITSVVTHGQGSSPSVVASGSRSEVGIGGASGVQVSVPERNLREYQARLTKERFTVVYAGNASRTLFPGPTNATEMAVTRDAKPVRVSNAGSVQTVGAAEDYTVADYGLGRYVAKFAVAPGSGNDIVVEFEREVYA
ncbi:MAG: hypothetical protein CMK70_13595 [Pseudohongiella sp.]|nr:hypothetical protein [Pseudohongiella sp.]|tara:strand:- start:2532 stop:5516 length:2985 start_codon:yes stop_codon:yes gene_type:complete